MLAPGAFSSHWQTYGAVPALKEVVVDIVALWSASMAVGLADSAGAVRPGFTVRETMLDMTSSEGDPLSVTCSLKDHEPVVDN